MLFAEMPKSPDTLRLKLTEFSFMALRKALKSTVLDLPDFVRSSKFLQHERNIINPMVSTLGLTGPSSFAQQIFFVASMRL